MHARKKKKKHALKWLKCLKLDLLLHCQFSLNSSKIIFIKSTLSVAPEKVFNRVSRDSTYIENEIKLSCDAILYCKILRFVQIGKFPLSKKRFPFSRNANL